MTRLRVGIANCPIGGAEVTLQPGGGWVRDRIDLSLSGLRISIRQTPDGMPRQHSRVRGRVVHTTTIEIGDLPARRLAYAERAVDDLCWLLSFATMSPVRPFTYRFGSSARSSGVQRTASIFRPTIETTDGEAVRSYLRHTWPRFRGLKRSRCLPQVIDYIVLADHSEQPIEVSALLAFTALESLKSTHSPGRRGNFENRVRAMLHAVGMRPALHRLVLLRNRLVHEGMAAIPISRLVNHYDRLQELLREYLLRLLGFSGSFLTYSSASRAVRHL